MGSLQLQLRQVHNCLAVLTRLARTSLSQGRCDALMLSSSTIHLARLRVREKSSSLVHLVSLNLKDTSPCYHHLVISTDTSAGYHHLVTHVSQLCEFDRHITMWYGWHARSLTRQAPYSKVSSCSPKRRLWKAEPTFQHAFPGEVLFRGVSNVFGRLKRWKGLPLETHAEMWVRPSTIVVWEGWSQSVQDGRMSAKHLQKECFHADCEVWEAPDVLTMVKVLSEWYL